MQITNSNISMQSRQQLTKDTKLEESVNYWKDDTIVLDKLELSNAAKLANKNNIPIEKAKKQEFIFELSASDKSKILLLEKFMQKLTGKTQKFSYFEKIVVKQASVADISRPTNQPVKLGWGFEYNRTETYIEKEKLAFNATGNIETADGQSINVSLQLNMSREYASYHNINIKAGDALIDPIVINFDGKGTELTKKKYVFDIDSDGIDDNVSFVKAGSGVLAIDLNRDGLINNGTELFGPNTGNGFNELKQYDKDNNGWIDENDDVFSRLKIWTKDTSEDDQLFALVEKGIGAIYLGNIDTQFSIKDKDNIMHGQMRSTGIYLMENGTVGSVHQIDLAK